jgi:hypothetical protein
MTPATTKPTPLKWRETPPRDGRSRQERLAGLIQLGKAGVRKAIA